MFINPKVIFIHWRSRAVNRELYMLEIWTYRVVYSVLHRVLFRRIRVKRLSILQQSRKNLTIRLLIWLSKKYRDKLFIWVRRICKRLVQKYKLVFKWIILRFWVSVCFRIAVCIRYLSAALVSINSVAHIILTAIISLTWVMLQRWVKGFHYSANLAPTVYSKVAKANIYGVSS